MKLVILCKNQIPFYLLEEHFKETGDELIDIYNMYQFREILKEEKFDYLLADRFAIEYYSKLGTEIRKHADDFIFLYYEQTMTVKNLLIYWMAYNGIQQMDPPRQTEIYDKLVEISELIGAKETPPVWYQEMPKADKKVFDFFYANCNEEQFLRDIAEILYGDKSPSKVNSLYVHIHNIRELFKKHLDKTDVLIRTSKNYYMLDVLQLDALPLIEEIPKLPEIEYYYQQEE